MTTPLFDILKRRIQGHGPISLADYMTECLMHPQYGYYTTREVFGSKGDFTTAPEVSQIFGEMVGLWLVDRWQALGQPNRFNLIELGPGRGILMHDILRVTKSVPNFHAAMQLHMVEMSSKLRAIQSKKLSLFGLSIQHHDSIKSIDVDVPTLIIGNEFIDALPIQQFQRENGKWLERLVDFKDDALCFSLSTAGPQIMLADEDLRKSAGDGDVLEVCPAALSITSDIAAILSNTSGACLLLDYGYSDHLMGDSFQALKDHQYVDGLAEPGLADLTAHVNFRALGDAASQKGLTVHGPIEQGSFLMQLGAGQRTMQLATDKDNQVKADLLNDLKRLTAADQMGTLFKAIAFDHGIDKIAAGFRT